MFVYNTILVTITDTHKQLLILLIKTKDVLDLSIKCFLVFDY
jgi:hypothetical protein